MAPTRLDLIPLLNLPRLFPMTWLLLPIAGVAPFFFASYGRRFLGNQTHPAALFLLAWMATAFVLDGASLPQVPVGVSSLVWVLLGFGVVALVRKLRAGPDKGKKAE